MICNDVSVLCIKLLLLLYFCYFNNVKHIMSVSMNFVFFALCWIAKKKEKNGENAIVLQSLKNITLISKRDMDILTALNEMKVHDQFFLLCIYLYLCVLNICTYKILILFFLCYYSIFSY